MVIEIFKGLLAAIVVDVLHRVGPGLRRKIDKMDSKPPSSAEEAEDARNWAFWGAAVCIGALLIEFFAGLFGRPSFDSAGNFTASGMATLYPVLGLAVGWYHAARYEVIRRDFAVR